LATLQASATDRAFERRTGQARTLSIRPAADNRRVPAQLPSAQALLRSLIGQPISTVARGRPNTILDVGDTEVLVRTGHSSNSGASIPIAYVEAALHRLEVDGEIEISVPSLGHRRSSFVGAVLLTLPGAQAISTSPPHVRLLADTHADYRLAAAGDLNVWWYEDPAERFWLEITDRPDIGVDLHCPQRDAAGNRSPGYSLIWWVKRGDVIFHYDENEQSITSWSRSVGEVAEGPVVWLSHRGATRRRLLSARPQPGWWLDLDGPYPLDEPLTLDQLRANGPIVRRVLDGLEQRDLGSVYFPFYFYGGTTLRPMQPYLNKLPAALVGKLPTLNAAAESATATVPFAGTESAGQTHIGAEYRPAAVSTLPDSRDPFSVDPAVVERGLRGHADTQNALATAVNAAGLTPLSPTAADPNFDLAWEADGGTYVAEVKSITAANEERQLRLGLGQVLRYRSLLAEGGCSVFAVLAVELAPSDPSWAALCSELGVVLVATPNFSELFE
jgi:hypothetical protein